MLGVDEVLRAEVIRRADADGAAVRDFLVQAAASETRPAARSPWPYALLELSEPPEFAQRVLDVVHDNVAWLRGVIEGIGWLGQSLVGQDGADAAWLVLQHAGSGVPTIGTPDNLAFQAGCVPLLLDAVHRGEVHPRHLAHVSDNLSQSDPPYAVLTSAYTTVDGTEVLRPDLDAGLIEANRRRIGLQPLADDLIGRRGGGWPEPWPLPQARD